MESLSVSPIRSDGIFQSDRLPSISRLERRKWIGILRLNVAAVSETLDGQLRPEPAIFGGGLTLLRRTPIIPVSVTIGASNQDETVFSRRSLQLFVDVSLNWRY